MRRFMPAVAVLLLVVAGCGGSDDGTADDGRSPGTTAAPGTTATPGEGDGAVITIADFDFGGPVTVAAGETITVRNTDGVTHTWTASDGAFDSGNIAGGSEFSTTLDAPGEYAFFCEIHPSMTGTITVTGEGEAAATPTTAATRPPMGPAAITVADQASNGASVTVASLTLPAPGYVVVHADGGGAPGAVIGHSDLLPAGTSTDVRVFLQSRLQESATVFPMAHIDVNGNGEYEFAPPEVTTDAPALTAAGEVAVAAVAVTVEIDY
jgi:plastocyanin